jgi:ABC-type nitrate/sulfonate/bicarbonate transport system substrate-binding protein
VSITAFVRAVVILASAWFALDVHAQTPLRVIAFDGGWNLPIWAAQRQGFFEAQGIAVQLSYTPNSALLITSLQEANSEIGFAVIDNAIPVPSATSEWSSPSSVNLLAHQEGQR